MSISIAPPSGSGVPSSGVPPSSMPIALKLKASADGQDEQEISLAGTLRPFVAEEMALVRSSLEQAAWSTRGTLCVNLKRLRYMNNVAFLELNRFVRWAVNSRPDLRIKFIVSSVIPWAIRKFQVIAELYPAVTIEVYDKAFYPIQPVMEDDTFIKVLRLQAKIIWEHERERLSWHGWRPGLRIADICCGIGDFAILLQQDLRPEYLVGVDHSKPFLRYASQLVADFGLENIEYQYGDASALLLPDQSFDMVSCRLSLQVFNEPNRILQEMVRICRPGGRIYITNEMFSGVCGFPNAEIVRATYQRMVALTGKVGMDMDIGLRTRQILADAGLEDIKVHLIEISNMNTEPADFAKVVESWVDVADVIAQQAGATVEDRKIIRDGHHTHIETIKSPRGYSLWPVYAGSGRKPFRVA
jgi:ubiquinone/menaquinone biosynthesis C-methylase UbiE